MGVRLNMDQHLGIECLFLRLLTPRNIFNPSAVRSDKRESKYSANRSKFPGAGW